MKISVLRPALFVLMVSMSVVAAHAQVTLDWVGRFSYPNSRSVWGDAMALDSVGNVYVTGRDNMDPPGFTTVKFDSTGQVVWSVRYVGGQAIVAQPVSIQCDRAGNVYVGAEDVEYILIKYNASGIQQWVRRYNGGGGNADLSDLTMPVDTNVASLLATGSAFFPSGVVGCLTLRCVSTNGDTLWRRPYTDLARSFCRGIATSLSRVAVVGVASVVLPSPRDFVTLNYALDGTPRWARTWDGPANSWDVAYDVATEAFGNTYVTGFATMDSSERDFDIVTIKYDSLGNERWVRFYDGPADSFSYDWGYFVETDPWGNVVVGGSENGVSSWQDYVTLKYDPEGNLLWQRSFNGTGNLGDHVQGLATDRYGGVYVTGNTDKTTTLYKTLTIKYTPNGDVAWMEEFPVVDTISAPKAIIVDQNLNVYVAGSISVANPGGASKDMIVLKYSQKTTSVAGEPEGPSEFALHQNYPNPFNAETVIGFSVPEGRDLVPTDGRDGQIPISRHVILKVYNVLGQEVATLVDGAKPAGEHSVTFDASHLSAGVYLYRLQSGTDQSTRKLVLIK